MTNLTNNTADDLSGSVGDGESNTAILVTALETASETGRAAQLCDNYTGGSQNDWFLSSLGEFKLMCENKAAIGGLRSDYYWSSSESSSNYAWNVYAHVCGTKTSYLKGGNRYVRPIRAF
jgi:hypothetical protein